jgi:hypothetical protein
MRFLELTKKGDGWEYPILINVDNITLIRPDQDKLSNTEIHFSDGLCISVAESYDDIKQKC